MLSARTMDRRRGYYAFVRYGGTWYSLVSRYAFSYRAGSQVSDHTLVAKQLPGRTDDQCAKRWRENLDPAISRRPWTTNEDEVLMDQYESLGKHWKEIASFFEGRPPVRCRNRVQSLIRAKRRAAKAERAGKGRNKRPVHDELLKSVDSMNNLSVESWTDLARSSPPIWDVGCFPIYFLRSRY